MALEQKMDDETFNNLEDIIPLFRDVVIEDQEQRLAESKRQNIFDLLRFTNAPAELFDMAKIAGNSQLDAIIAEVRQAAEKEEA